METSLEYVKVSLMSVVIHVLFCLEMRVELDDTIKKTSVRLDALRDVFQRGMLIRVSQTHETMSMRCSISLKLVSKRESLSQASEASSKCCIVSKIIMDYAFSEFSLQTEGFGDFGLQIRILQAK